MTFELHHLKAFSTIVAVGSLGRAAAHLNVTQPALSRTIRKLEESAGAPLFERHSKGMQLTDIGRALVPHASLLVREAEHAAEEIRARLGLARGVIRVGAVASLACSLLPWAIGKTCEEFPDLQVEVLEGVWDRLADALVTHEIDLALGVETDVAEGIEAIKDCRWQDASYVVAGNDHALRGRANLSLADTLSQRWAILPKDTAPFDHMKSLFVRNGLPMPNVVVQTRSVTVLKSLVCHSGFLGWMPEPMFESERRAGLMGPLVMDNASDTRTLTAFRRSQGLLPAPAVKLLEKLRDLTAASPAASIRVAGPATAGERGAIPRRQTG